MASTALEKIIAFNSISRYLNRIEIDKLKNTLQLTDEDLKRSWGKDIESQFFFTLMYRDNIEYVLPFDEQFPKLFETPTPDVLIVFKTGEKILVEVKGSHTTEKKISSSRINKQIEFSKRLEIPLYYLFYLNGYWGLYEADYLLNKKTKINLPDDLNASKFESIFKIKIIKFRKGIIFKALTSKTKRPNHRIRNSKFRGYLIGIKLQFDNYDLELKVTKSNYTILIRFLVCLIGSFNETNTKCDRSELKSQGVHQLMETYIITKDIVLHDFYFILQLIYGTINSKNRINFNATNFVSFLNENNANKTKMLKYQDLIVDPINYLFNNGIPVTIN